MARRGQRWTVVPGAIPWNGGGAVAHTRRVGGRYVPSSTVRHEYRGIRMKSSYETNYGRFLDYLGIQWLYEPRRFVFTAIVTGVRVFTPDFYLPQADEFHECKGYMDRKSATKIKRLAKYYPEVTLVLIDVTFFRSACRQGLCRVIPGWRCRHTLVEG